MKNSAIIICFLFTLMSATCKKTTDNNEYPYVSPVINNPSNPQNQGIKTYNSVLAVPFTPTHCNDKIAVRVDIDNDGNTEGSNDVIFFVQNPDEKWHIDEALLISFETTSNFDGCPSLDDTKLTQNQFQIITIK